MCRRLISITQHEIRFLKALYDGSEEFAKGILVNLHHYSTVFVELVGWGRFSWDSMGSVDPYSLPCVGGSGRDSDTKYRLSLSIMCTTYWS